MSGTIWVTDTSIMSPVLIVLCDVKSVGETIAKERWYVNVGGGPAPFVSAADAQRVIEALGASWADREAAAGNA